MINSLATCFAVFSSMSVTEAVVEPEVVVPSVKSPVVPSSVEPPVVPAPVRTPAVEPLVPSSVKTPAVSPAVPRPVASIVKLVRSNQNHSHTLPLHRRTNPTIQCPVSICGVEMPAVHLSRHWRTEHHKLFTSFL